VVPFGTGLYRQAMRQRVYAELLALAHETLKKGHSAILDATFSQRRWRKAAELLSADTDVNLIFVECICSKKTIRSRLKQRERSSALSDARLEHFAQMVEDFEPVVEFRDEIHLKVNTDKPLHHALVEVLSKGFDSKSRQAEILRQTKTT